MNIVKSSRLKTVYNCILKLTNEIKIFFYIEQLHKYTRKISGSIYIYINIWQLSKTIM